MCQICDGASEDEVRLGRARKIDTYGWMIEAVEAGPQNDPWAYTIGLIEHLDHPELVVTSISPEDAAVLFDQLVETVRAGYRLAPGRSATAHGVPVEFAAVHRAQFGYGVFDSWFDHYRSFGPELSALQVILPNGIFCSYHARYRPRLDLPEPALDSTYLNRAARRAGRRRGHRGGQSPPGRSKK